MRPTHRARGIASRALTALAMTAALSAALAPATAANSPALPTSHPADESPSRTTSMSLDEKHAVVTGSASDPDDVDGRLDIQRVRDRVIQLDGSHYLISYRVRTYTPFGSERLDGHWRNFDLELDRDGLSGSERTIVVLDDDGVLQAKIVSTATREVLATLSATRPNDRAIDISGPRRLLGARSYFWTSNFHTDRAGSCGWNDGYPINCQDAVPDDGWLGLDRPAWPDPRNLARNLA
jgi:hypothetical protein